MDFRSWRASFVCVAAVLTLLVAKGCKKSSQDASDRAGNGAASSGSGGPSSSSGFAIGEGPVDYLVIVGDDALEPAVSAIAQLRRREGLRVETIPVDRLPRAGRDRPERIRQAIRAQHDSHPLQYVLLVGSHDLIPMRLCHVDPDDHQHPDFQVYSDSYYADLDGSWDADGDGFFGEAGDDQLDFRHDVRVGRIPWDDVATVGSIAAKTAAFETSTASWKQASLLMAGTIAVAGDAPLHCDIIRQQTFANRPVTTAYDSNPYVQGDHVLGNGVALSLLQQNDYGFIYYTCHGSRNWASIGLSTSDVATLDDSRPAIVIAADCNNAEPADDGLGRALIRRGAAAFVGSTGISGPFGANLSGVEAQRQMVHHVVADGWPIGEALRVTQQDYADAQPTGALSPEVQRNLVEFVLYGDPALDP